MRRRLGVSPGPVALNGPSISSERNAAVPEAHTPNGKIRRPEPVRGALLLHQTDDDLSRSGLDRQAHLKRTVVACRRTCSWAVSAGTADREELDLLPIETHIDLISRPACRARQQAHPEHVLCVDGEMVTARQTASQSEGLRLARPVILPVERRRGIMLDGRLERPIADGDATDPRRCRQVSNPGAPV